MSLSKQDIIKQLQKSSEEFANFCTGIEAAIFFQQPEGKWSIAQNVKHLIISANTTRLAYILPKFIVRLYTGKPNRISRSYDELVSKYKNKLQQGGKASGIYIPKPVLPKADQTTLINDFISSMNKLIASIDKYQHDAQLDQYLAPHPLLGKITLRELCYFTIYHTEHHLNIIKERLRERSQKTEV